MEGKAIVWFLGALPGLTVIVHTLWQRRRQSTRVTAVASDEQRCAASTCRPEQRFDLWRKPHCFARQEDSAAVHAAKLEPLASRPRVVLRLVGGVILAASGGLTAVLVSRAIA